MDRNEAQTLQQVVADQAERLDSVREQVSQAKWALMDHNLDLLRYWLNQIEETSGSLVSFPASSQVARPPYGATLRH